MDQASYLPALKQLAKKLKGTRPPGRHGIQIIGGKAFVVNDQSGVFIRLASLRRDRTRREQ